MRDLLPDVARPWEHEVDGRLRQDVIVGVVREERDENPVGVGIQPPLSLQPVKDAADVARRRIQPDCLRRVFHKVGLRDVKLGRVELQRESVLGRAGQVQRARQLLVHAGRGDGGLLRELHRPDLEVVEQEHPVILRRRRAEVQPRTLRRRHSLLVVEGHEAQVHPGPEVGVGVHVPVVLVAYPAWLCKGKVGILINVEVDCILDAVDDCRAHVARDHGSEERHENQRARQRLHGGLALHLILQVGEHDTLGNTMLLHYLLVSYRFSLPALLNRDPIEAPVAA
mmetsp:Transcript_51057/g.154578  ORF Transcript_51057/g.154578 Transcript_51057/m.154578 type:complete len:283 (+) Transcript_51057:1587-2435(+)